MYELLRPLVGDVAARRGALQRPVGRLEVIRARLERIVGDGLGEAVVVIPEQDEEIGQLRVLPGGGASRQAQ